MARPSKTSAIDYTAAHDLSHGLLERAACPDGVAFTLLKDSVVEQLTKAIDIYFSAVASIWSHVHQ